MDSLLSSFQISLRLIGQMGLSVLLGFWLARRKIIDSGTLTQLTRLLIEVFIPCVFFVSMTRSMNWPNLKESLMLMGFSAAWTLGSLAFCMTIFRLFPSGHVSEDRAVTAMAMVQNGIYLPLPIVYALIPAGMKDKAALLIGMIVLPSVLAQWTISINLLSGGKSLQFRERIRLAVNPPIISLLAGSVLGFVPWIQAAALDQPESNGLLRMMFSTMHFLGGALSPMAMIVLGAFIGSISVSRRLRFRHLFMLIGLRLVGLPALMYLLLHRGWIQAAPLAGLILVIEAAAPPATNHSLIARRYNGEWELVSSIQLVVHAVAVLTLSFWIAMAIGYGGMS